MHFIDHPFSYIFLVMTYFFQVAKDSSLVGFFCRKHYSCIGNVHLAIAVYDIEGWMRFRRMCTKAWILHHFVHCKVNIYLPSKKNILLCIVCGKREKENWLRITNSIWLLNSIGHVILFALAFNVMSASVIAYVGLEISASLI